MVQNFVIKGTHNYNPFFSVQLKKDTIKGGKYNGNWWVIKNTVLGHSEISGSSTKHTPVAVPDSTVGR